MLHAALSPTGAPLSFFTLTYRSRVSLPVSSQQPSLVSSLFHHQPSSTLRRILGSSPFRSAGLGSLFTRVFTPSARSLLLESPSGAKKSPACAAHKQTPLHHRSCHPQQDSSIAIIAPRAICCSHQRFLATFVAHRASLPFACSQHRRHPTTTAASQATACWGPVALSSRS